MDARREESELNSKEIVLIVICLFFQKIKVDARHEESELNSKEIVLIVIVFLTYHLLMLMLDLF